MLHFNSTLWMIFFQTVKPLTDNTGLVIILFSIFLELDSPFSLFFTERERCIIWVFLTDYISFLFIIC